MVGVQLGTNDAFVGTVGWFQVPHIGQPQGCEVAVAFGRHDPGGDTDVVATVVEDGYPLDDHPVGECDDQRHSVVARFHGDVRELVGVLAGGAGEVFGEVVVVLGQKMHGEMGCE